MLSKGIKNKVLKENDLDKVLEILKPYCGKKWDDVIMEHIQKITPEEENSIEDFSYLRKSPK